MARIVVVVLAVLAVFVGGAVAGYLAAPRYKVPQRSAQPFINVMDADLPLPPGVTRIDERLFGRGTSGRPSPGGKDLWTPHAVKGLALEIGDEDPEHIVMYYADHVGKAMEQCGARFGGSGTISTRRLGLFFYKDAPQVHQENVASGNVWHSAGRWSTDGTYVEVTGELYCLKDRKLLPADEPLPPKPWQRVLLVRIEAQVTGCTEPGHWAGLDGK